jgi:hypothetical protein
MLSGVAVEVRRENSLRVARTVAVVGELRRSSRERISLARRTISGDCVISVEQYYCSRLRPSKSTKDLVIPDCRLPRKLVCLRTMEEAFAETLRVVYLLDRMATEVET